MTQNKTRPTISVVIPSFKRGEVLLQTVRQLLIQEEPAEEIIVVDQTDYRPDNRILDQLNQLSAGKKILFIRKSEPSIPAAMNAGLRAACSTYVLFLDDDIEVESNFIAQHRDGLLVAEHALGRPCDGQVGQVLQPGQSSISRSESYHGGYGLNKDLTFPFNSDSPAWIHNCMAGNLCVKTASALACGGLDENFVGAAYRFETEFARRLSRHREMPLHYWPAAKIDHLQLSTGGTRSSAHHLRTASPTHSVGEYYYGFREGRGSDRLKFSLRRFFSSFVSRFYLTHPWYLPVRLLAELRGLHLAARLSKSSPQLIDDLAVSADGNGPLRLAIVMSHPTQHFAAVYRHLASSSGLRVKVFFLANNGVEESPDPGFGQKIKWDRPLACGYPHEFLAPPQMLQNFSFMEMDHSEVVKAVSDFKPSTIWLHGYGQRANWRVLKAFCQHCKIIYTSDSNLGDPRSLARRAIKYLVVTGFLRRCHHFLSISRANSCYLRHYGVSEESITETSFPIDMEFWQAAAQSAGDTAGAEVRQQLEISTSDTVFLFAGKLLPHKRADEFISAFALAKQKNSAALIVGSGEQLDSLRGLVEKLNIGSRVRFLGFINQTELPRYFATSDVLVFPSSREPYGTIAAEVLPFGLSIIASHNIGAVGSSIVESKNALIYPSGDVRALAEHIGTLSSDVALRQRFGQESIQMAESQDARHMAACIVKLCQDAQK